MVEDTESVSAGEVCSISVATKLGMRDTSNNKNYYLREHGDIKTHNGVDDESKIYKLCETTNTSETQAAPLCVLESNAGFGFTKKKSPGSLIYDTCVTAECPVGFNVDPKKPNSCLKPKKPKTTLLKNTIEERWYDWFMIPDYHLGNKYARIDNQNYAPCKKGSIPSYETDPIDGEKNASNKNELDKCVEKAKYFEGKYFNSDTYCPLAWIYRVGATNKDLKLMYSDLINYIDETREGNEHLDTLKKNIDNLIHNEIYKPVLEYGFDDYIGPSQTDESTAACSSIENGQPKRRDNAFKICRTIKELGEDKYIEKLMRENNEDESTAKKKYKRAIQACNTVFCNDKNNTVCFPEVEKKEFDKNFKTVPGQEPQPDIDPEIEKAKILSTFFYALKIIGIIVVSVFGFIMIIIPLFKYIYENAPSIYLAIKDSIARNR